MKRLMLVFDEGAGEALDLQKFVDSLDTGAQIYTLDHNVCFILSGLSAKVISERFVKFAGSRLFFVADVTRSESSGRMLGSFWDFIKQPALQNAAE